MKRCLFKKDKVVLVTGGDRGIGRSIAPGFAEAGADVLVSSRNKRPSELDRVAEQVRALWRKAGCAKTGSGKCGRIWQG